MKGALSGLVLGALLAGSALAQDGPGAFDGRTVMLDQDGQRFVCDLRSGKGGVVVADPCQPLVTTRQADRIAAMAETIDGLTEDLAVAEREAETQAAAAAAALAARAEAEAQAAEARAQAEALRIEVAALREQLDPFLAESAQRAADAAVMDRAVALEQAAVKVGLQTEAEVETLALAALQSVMAELGDRCALSLAAVEANGGEDWLMREIAGRTLAGLDIPEPTLALLLSLTFDKPNDREGPRYLFQRAYEDAENFEVVEKGRFAGRLARDNMDRLGETVDAVFENPANIAMAEDRSKVMLVGCEG